jgi:hypothetical protein
MTLPKVDSLDRYGGKTVSLVPITDPTTERSAEAASEAYASVAAATHTAIRAWARFRRYVDDLGTVRLDLVAHDAVWGSRNDVAPTIARTSPGVFSVTWPAQVVDELGDTQSVNLRSALALIDDAGDVPNRIVRCRRTAANAATVRTFTLAGASAEPVDSTVDVFTL